MEVSTCPPKSLPSAWETIPMYSRASQKDSMNPMLSSWGVVGALPMTLRPSSSTTMTSVIVPPASQATR